MSRLHGALTLYAMELRALLRDSRTIVVSILLPLLIMPLVLGASSRIKRTSVAAAGERAHTYAIAEGPLREKARALLDEARARPLKTEGEGASLTGELVSPTPLLPVESPDPAAALAEGKVDLYIEPITEEQAAEHEKKTKVADLEGASPTKKAPEFRGPPAAVVLLIHYREDRPASRAAINKARRLLAAHRNELRAKALTDRGYRPIATIDEALPIVLSDVATDAERAGSRVGRYITALFMLFMLVGGGSIASDSIAGEKERGTLETLLSAGAGRSAILTSKFLIVLTATLATTVIQVGNLLVSVLLGLAGGSGALGAHVTWGTTILLFVLYLPVCALVASVLVLTFGLAHSYKEAQLYFLPLTIVGPVIALAPALPGIELRSAILIVPLINISVAVRDVLLGEYDWPMMAASFVITALAAAQIARVSVRLLSAERLLLANDAVNPKDADALFRRRALHWFAALWAFVLLASLAGAGGGDVFRSLLLGQLIFLVAIAVIVRGYGLNPRRALSLRMPKPLVWPAVILGAPAAAVVATGLFRLASPALRVSEKSIEQLSKALFPENMPLWQLAVALAVVPPICEELLFRGLLLHGLRTRLRPVSLCITIGVIFGVFHLALFRLVTTTFLGIVITAVALMTGSVFPGILWHAINNALPLVLVQAGRESIEFPLWAYAAAAGVLGACLWVIWKNRSPHTDRYGGR